MKKTRISVIAAAALMTVFMLSGCGKDAGNISKNENANNSVTTAADSAAPTTDSAASAPDAADSQAETSSVEAAKPAEGEKKDEAKPAETKAPETKIPESQPAAAAETKAATTEAPKLETKAPEVTVPEFAPVKVEGDVYAGTYAEQSTGLATMEITNIGNNTYSVHIAWSVTYTEVNTWDLTGSFDGKGVLSYTNCRKTTIAYDLNGGYAVSTDGLQTPYTVYSAGAGTLKVTDYGIVWNDTMGDILPGTTFVPVQGSPSEKNFQNPEPTDSNKNDKYADEKPMRDEMMVGNFYDGNGSKTWMDIVKQDDGTYYISITSQVNMGTYYGYGLIGTLSGDTLTYSNGAKSELVYDENGNITSNLILEQNHSGTLRNSNTGLVWIDSDGSSYVFVNSMM